MKHEFLNGYYDGYDKEIENMNEDEKQKLIELAIVKNYDYFIGSLALVNNNFNLQGLRIKGFEAKVREKNDIYIKKNYGNYLLGNKRDSIMFFKKLYEVMYIGVYQDFESYISQMLKVLFWFMPELLEVKEKEKYIKFTGKNKIIEREMLVERVISSLMMRGNIIDALDKLMNLMNYNIDNLLLENEKIKLTTISLNRNLIVHNSGIVNSIYLRKLKDNNIQCDYRKGQYIFEGKIDQDCIITNEIEDFINLIVEKIDKLMSEYFKIK